MAATPRLLLTGATGNVGSALAATLTNRGIPFRALVRSPGPTGRLSELPGVELVTGDLDDRESLAPALAGVERAFLVTRCGERAEAQQRGFLEAARRAGVRHVVKLSQLGADPSSPVRFLRTHAAVEAALRTSGMAYTFLRPNLFMQGLLGFRPTIVGKGQFYAPADGARVSVVDVRDVAAAAAAVLVEDGHEGKTYDLTGPEGLTHTDMAALLAAALARPVVFMNLPEDAMRGALLALGFPEWQADGLIEDYAHYRRGEAAAVCPGVRQATGRPPRAFIDFARDYAPAFR